MPVIETARIANLDKDTRKRYQRLYWGDSTSMIRFNLNGDPLFTTGSNAHDGKLLWTRLGNINKEAIDWVEINTNYERIEKKANFSLKFKKNKTAIQTRIDEINKEMNRPNNNYPEEENLEEWKKLWKEGVEIEASYAEGNFWTKVGKEGESFNHKNRKVKFRLDNSIR